MATSGRAHQHTAAQAGASHLGACSHRGMQLTAGHLQLLGRCRLRHVRAGTSAALPLPQWVRTGWQASSTNAVVWTLTILLLWLAWVLT